MKNFSFSEIYKRFFGRSDKPVSAANLKPDIKAQFQTDLNDQVSRVLKHFGLPDTERETSVNVSEFLVFTYNRRGHGECEEHQVADLMIGSPTWILDAATSSVFPILLAIKPNRISSARYEARYILISKLWKGAFECRELGTLVGISDGSKDGNIAFRFLEINHRDKVGELLKFAATHGNISREEIRERLHRQLEIDLESPLFTWVPNKIATARESESYIEYMTVYVGHNPSTKEILQHMQITEESTLPNEVVEETKAPIPTSAVPPHRA